MKVYVIKNPKGEYMTETRDFINSIWQATLFNDVETALCYVPNDCRVYECIFMERDAFKEHDKQVRKEVCEEIREELEPKNANHIDELINELTEQTILISKGFKACKERVFNKLDQIQENINKE